MTDEPIWTPRPDRVRASRLEQFRAFLAARLGVVVDDSRALHDFSCRPDGIFWRALWEFAELPGDPGGTNVVGESFDTTTFFPEGRVDIAAAMLAGAPDETVVIGCNEAGTTQRLTRGELRRQVAALAASLRTAGVEEGDVVAAYATTSIPTLVTMLGAMACGAVFTSASVEFGVDAVVDRFSQTAPKVLLAIDHYTYAGRQFDHRDRVADVARRLDSLHTVIVGASDDSLSSRPHDLDLGAGRTVLDYDDVVAAAHPLQTVERGFNDPGSVLFSSGTTGRPKCIVHRAGGVLLKHLSELLLHCDIRSNDRLFYYATPSWMMWNWLVSGLSAGACIVLYSGSAVAPDPLQLLEMAEREQVTYFGTSPGFIDTVRRTVGGDPAAIRRRFDLSTLRTIGSTGAPLSPTAARFAASWAPDVQVLSKSGGTDLCGGLVTGDPTRPVWAGEIQAPAVGCAIAIVDDDGNDVPPGERGELVSRTPFPSMPLGFLGDDSRTLLRRTYFDRFPGCWHQSDFVRRTEHDGYVIDGRSDTTLNVHGVRIGTAEIYSQLDRFPWIQAAAAIEHRNDEASRLVLLVELAPHETLSDRRRDEIAAALREHCSPRHVPALTAPVPELPRTMNGKVSEVAASDAFNGRDVRGHDTLANPQVLAVIRESASAQAGEV